MSSIYSKMIKYLKTQTLTYLIGGNPLNSYNYHTISSCIFMYTVVINYIINYILLISIKTNNRNTGQRLIDVNEMIYFNMCTHVYVAYNICTTYYMVE